MSYISQYKGQEIDDILSRSKDFLDNNNDNNNVDNSILENVLDKSLLKGGSAGQILTKNSNNDFDFIWQDAPEESEQTVILDINIITSEGTIQPTIIVKDRDTDEECLNVVYNNASVTVEIPIGMPYIVTGSNVDGYSTPSSFESIAYSNKTINLYYQRGIRYGFKRDTQNSDPSSRITYLYDATNFTPMTVTKDSDSWNPGSWNSFINEVATPVMLKYNGTEGYELDRNNTSLKAGTSDASDVANTSYEGNAMVRFEKWKWVKRYTEGNYQYVIFSDCQYDSDYHAYAHQREDGSIADRMYYGMFKGSDVNSRLRSLSGRSIMVSQTRNTEVAYAQANGTGWDTIYNSAWQYIADLLTLLGKSDNTQDVFGNGRNNTSSAAATGSLVGKGAFWGSTSVTSSVKTLWIEDFWGNVWEGMRGLINYNGIIKTKMYPPYNFDGTNYIDTGITPGGTSGGYISVGILNDVSGFVPQTASGSATTYMCDGLWFNNGQVNYAFVGGGWGNGLLCGARCVSLSDAASSTGTRVGSRPSYLSIS